MDNRAFSRDGYIVNQDYTYEFTYGIVTSNHNGCGWIAMYNLLKSIGREKDYQLIHKHMSEILPYGGIVGTPTRTMKKILNNYGIEFKQIRSKKNILNNIENIKCGIFRYAERGVPHYVAFTKYKDNKFRFFNAQLGNEEHISTMEEFFKKHVIIPGIKALIIEKDKLNDL